MTASFFLPPSQFVVFMMVVALAVRATASAAMSEAPGPQLATSGVLEPQRRARAEVTESAPALTTPSSAQSQHRPHGPRGYPGRRRPGKDDGLLADVSDALGPPIPDPAANSRGAAAGGAPLSIYRNTSVPTLGLASLLSEPSTDQSGRNIFATGNGYAAFSKDNGVTWRHLGVSSIFGPGFCCDQVTVYDKAHDRQHWILQYLPQEDEPPSPGSDHLTLANSPGGDFVKWCPYRIDPATLGWREGGSLDYNDLVVGARHLYLTTRIIRFIPGTGLENYEVLSAVLMRISLEDLAACRPAHYDVVFRKDIPGKPGTAYGDVRMAQGVTDVAYAGALATEYGVGRILRILVWPADSQIVTTVDRRVPAFLFMNRTGATTFPSCGSEDRSVANWCRINTSSLSSTFSGSGRDGRLWFAWDAQQQGRKRPFPYSRITELRTPDLTVLRSRDLYGLGGAHILPAIAADRDNRIGLVGTFGGGKGARAYFPGGMLGALDGDSLSVDYFLPGKGDACDWNPSDPDIQGIWGDYNTIRNWQGLKGFWLATTYARADNDWPIDCLHYAADKPANVVVRNVVFGQKRRN